MNEKTKARRSQYADAVLRSADRLVKLLDMGAPEIVIEQERMILMDRITKFPVNPEAQETVLDVHDEAHRREQEALLKSGFYDDQT